MLPGLSVVVFDARAKQNAFTFLKEKFGVHPDGRFGQRLGESIWNMWGYRLHDHWRADAEQFFYEHYVGFENGSVSA